MSVIAVGSGEEFSQGNRGTVVQIRPGAPELDQGGSVEAVRQSIGALETPNAGVLRRGADFVAGEICEQGRWMTVRASDSPAHEEILAHPRCRGELALDQLRA